jgi:ATP-dependent Lon protease
VTGSVNQQGDIQPIGGVNQKIEGFYDICRVKGITGTQGVIIPAENVEDLMLREDVIGAVREGKFHVYPVKRIEEGIEILTGQRAGGRTTKGKFEPGTVFALANARLAQMAKMLKTFH